MDDSLWSQVDAYATDLFELLDPALASVVSRSEEGDLPAIQVSECQGKFLEILVRGCGARRVLEIGTLGGFSTTFLARGVGPDGSVITLELDPRHAAVARESLRESGLETRVEVLEGDAHESLRRMIAEGAEPVDFVFLDAEKSGYPRYLEAILRLSRPGTMLVADNVVRRGNVLDSVSDDPNVRGVREFNARVAATPGLEATILQTVGTKGHDGLLLAVLT
jgi:predicted O-methyltransferase YrrM